MKRILVDDMSCEAIGAIGVLLAIRGKSMDDVEIVDIESERKKGLKEAVTPTLIQITPSPVMTEERGVIPGKYTVRHRTRR